MSDYLWDKTGEADEETKRLEELLGGFKFQPRPLELPDSPARRSSAARTRSLLSWPRLAVAASLAAALLVGAWLVLNERRATTNNAPPLAGHQDQPGVSAEPKQSPAVAPKNGGEDAPKNIDKPTPVPPREEVGAMRQTPRRPILARGGTKIRTPQANRIEAARHEKPGGTPGRRELIARQYTDEERAAAEKVMYALRVTSEKLAYARQQVQEAGRREPNR